MKFRFMASRLGFVRSRRGLACGGRQTPAHEFVELIIPFHLDIAKRAKRLKNPKPLPINRGSKGLFAHR
ncbi:MAG: hypothetical protein RL001_2440 [Pseudomonadota bacterium]|jgi:hypothetical protein